MATTTNYSWTTPDDTDLVKDGASAIRTLGSAIDTTVFTNAGAAVAKATVDAKGDLLVGTADNTVDRLAVGTDGYTLVADSSVSPTGLKWAAPGGSGANWSLLNTGGTALTGAATITVSGISSADKIMVLISQSSGPGSSTMGVRLNTNTGSIYHQFGMYLISPTAYATNNLDKYSGAGTFITIGGMSNNGASLVAGGVSLTGCNSTGLKQYTSTGSGEAAGGNGHFATSFQGYVNLSVAITSISVFCDSGNFDAGTVYVYTSA